MLGGVRNSEWASFRARRSCGRSDARGNAVVRRAHRGAVEKEKFSALRKVGYALIALGVFAIVGATALAASDDQTKGHLLFLTAAFMWACYAIVLRQSRLDPLHAAALVAAGLCLLYLPFYFVTQGAHALGAPLRDLAFQALFQGVVVSILALFFFGTGISLLGASAGAAFPRPAQGSAYRLTKSRDAGCFHCSA